MLTGTDQQTIKAVNTTIDRNEKLLDRIFERGKCREFIDALRTSGQTHVVNWINGNGGRPNDLIALISNLVLFISDSGESLSFGSTSLFNFAYS